MLVFCLSPGILWSRKWQPMPGIPAGRIPWKEEPGGLYSPWGRKESDTHALSISSNTKGNQRGFKNMSSHYCHLLFLRPLC